MAIVTEVSIPVFFNYVSGGLGNYSCAVSQGVFDTTTLRSTLEGVYTGSWPGNVNTRDILEITTGGFLTGSWPGNANTKDHREMLVSGTNMGLYPGNTNNWDLYNVPEDVHYTSVTSEGTPMTAQGSVLVEWNHFPFPPTVEPPPLEKVRDLTRFQKAYSFQRQQPVRIRLYRK